jgi:Protein of unknown function (DUF3037)
MTKPARRIERPYRAFYSLVQYCPDLSRLEVANIGVVIFCAELNYIDVRMTQNHKRISQMFGKGQRDLKRLRTVKAGLQEKLTTGGNELMSLEKLNHLAALHVNTIRMTQFMPCRVSTDPKVDLQNMFAELVEFNSGPKPISKVDALARSLEECFAVPDISNRIYRKLKVRIPILNREEEIPYGFQNGRLNLIAPVVFPVGKSAFEDRAAKYAIEGRSLYDNPDPKRGALQMLVVGQFEDGATDSVETAKRILDSHQVRFVRKSELPQLADEIRTNGHVATP